MVLDVEQILYDIIPSVRDAAPKEIRERAFKIKPGASVIVAEDSKVARSMLEQGLKTMGLPAIMHTTGLEARKTLRRLRWKRRRRGSRSATVSGWC